MPLFIAALWGALLSMVGTIVGKVLVSLGIGYVTYTGLQLLLDWAKATFLAGMSGVPAAAVGLAGTMKVGVCVSMLLSAIAMRATLNGLSAGGKLTKMAVSK